MSKKSARGPLSKNSSAASSAVPSSSKQSTQRSSISKSAFTPSHFQLALFASVIQGLESQQLRVHDTTTGRHRCQHTVSPGSRITCLEWGYYGSVYQGKDERENKKKRKRAGAKSEDAVLAYGTNTSDICLFSIAESKLVGKLSGGHEHGINDFRFDPHDYSVGWSVGGDGNLVEWDISRAQLKRKLDLHDAAIKVLCTPSPHSPQILCASSAPYSIDLSSSKREAFDAHRQPIHALFRSGTDDRNPHENFLAADSDRFINISSLSDKKLLRTLVTGGDIDSASLFDPSEGTEAALDQQMLAVLRKDGQIELFQKPFVAAQISQVNGEISSKRKSMTRKANAIVRLVSSDSKSTPIPAFSASLHGPELLLAIADGGVNVSFQKVRWQDEGTAELLFEGLKEVPVARVASTLNRATTNGVKDASKAHLDESHAVVVEGGPEGSSQTAAIAISSSEADSDEEQEAEDDSSEEDDEEGADMSERLDEEMEDADEQPRLVEDMALDEAEENEKDTAPTFGELAAAQSGPVISIGDALPAESALLPLEGSKALSLPAGASLTTVLSQSLRTNDNNLLESCLHNQSREVIQATIERLDSSLAGLLIQKLAERLSSRPGRYGHLTTWAQWICVVHGGALASQPAAVEKIKTLSKVLTQRSRCLDDLLLLKGKLDMLEAQLKYRRQLAAQRKQSRPEDDSNVIMIEGEDNWSSDEEAAQGKGKAPRRALDEISDLASSEDEDDEEESDEMPTTLPNGISLSDSEEEESVDSDEDPNAQDADVGVIEEEAEESDAADEDALSRSPSADEAEEEEEDAEEDDDVDSEMDSFIDDGPLASDGTDADDVDVDDDRPTPDSRPVKKPRRS